MNSQAKYESIQKFKASNSALIDSINFANVVAPFLYDSSTKGLLRKIAFSLFFSTRTHLLRGRSSSTLIYYSCRHKGRADYDYICRHIRNLIDCDYVESVERVSLAQPFRTLAKLSEGWRCARGYSTRIKERLGCAILIAKYRTVQLAGFIDLLSERRSLVTFCDAQPPENLMAQMAKVAGVATATNQHGQYRILDASNMSGDAEAYANFVSDKILCWGRATIKEFSGSGIHAERLVVTGWIKQWTNQKAGERVGIFGVMLNGENAKESNLRLLASAREVSRILGLRYLVRLHPWSRAQDYAGLIDDRCVALGKFDLNDYIVKVDFSIAHMTGATIEMLHVGAPVYLLDDGCLASAFRIEGLSYLDADSIALAVTQDIAAPGAAQLRFAGISRWYNDDRDQDTRIMRALLAHGN